MSQDKQTKNACVALAAAVTAFLAVHSVALHTSAHAQMQMPAHIVAPQTAFELTPHAAPVAAPAASPAAVRSVAASPARLATSNSPRLTRPVACGAPAEFTHLDRPLLRTMRYLASGAPLTIVAIGSSSTAGAGASSVEMNYPSQLAADLRERFPGHDITVLNRGVNGEETDNMMARFESDVIATHPQLVIWQVGTNSVLRDRSLAAHAVLLHQGIAQLKANNADVVLMDLQYSPAVIAKPETDDMVDQIALAAKTENVDVFERFAIMRNWSEVQHLSFDTFVAPDQLHMNDWGYGCVAKLLAGAIAEAATRPITSAAAHPAPSSAPAKPGVQ